MISRDPRLVNILLGSLIPLIMHILLLPFHEVFELRHALVLLLMIALNLLMPLHPIDLPLLVEFPAHRLQDALLSLDLHNVPQPVVVLLPHLLQVLRFLPVFADFLV